MMTHNWDTVRSDRLVRLLGEAIPWYRKPQYCGDCRVSWWSEVGEESCPCCAGELPLKLLIALEEWRLSRRE